MATAKIIPAEPVHFHPRALIEFEGLSPEARHVTEVRIKAHLGAVRFGRGAQNVEKCNEGLLSGGGGLPSVYMLRRQTKRFDLRVYFVIETGVAVILHVDPNQRRDRRSEGTVQSILARRKELSEHRVETKPLSAVRVERVAPRESVLPATSEDAPLSTLPPEVAAALVRDAPPPIEDRPAPSPAPSPAPAPSPSPASPLPADEPKELLGESVRKVLYEFRDDPAGLTKEDIAAVVPGNRTAQSVYDALSSLAETGRAVRVKGTRPMRWRGGPHVAEPLQGIFTAPKGYVRMVLAAVDIYTRRHSGRGPTAREIVQLAKDDGLGDLPIVSACYTAHDLVKTHRLARMDCTDGDDDRKRYRYIPAPGESAANIMPQEPPRESTQKEPMINKLTGEPFTRDALRVLKALRTYQRLPGARPAGALASDVCRLLQQQHEGRHAASNCYGVLEQMCKSGLTTKTRDERTAMWCFGLVDTNGTVYEGATLPPPPKPGVVKAAHTRREHQRRWEERKAARAKEETTTRAFEPPPPLPSAPPPPSSTSARAQLLDFADGFRACVGRALASDELTEDECAGALDVLKAIKQYTTTLREQKK